MLLEFFVNNQFTNDLESRKAVCLYDANQNIVDLDFSILQLEDGPAIGESNVQPIST